MDIAAVSMELSTSKVNTEVNLSLMKKTMDSAEQSAVEMLKMLPPSPYNFDVRA